METPEEALLSQNIHSSEYAQSQSAVMMKGKRTKRQRFLLLPVAPAVLPAASSTSSAEFSGSTTEEEEDMANCLILLAQGRAFDSAGPKSEAHMEEGGSGGGTQKFTSRRFAEAATTTNGKAGFYVYECKTCNKCFPSFQALGGHRASHKKPRIAAIATAAAATDEKRPMIIDEDSIEISMNSFSKPIMVSTNNNNINSSSSNNNKPRVHECSVCGSEFSSGQALGGHMRRHRPTNLPDQAQEVKKERNVLSLDLNLPAPSDDDRGELAKSPSTAFPFSSKQPLIFSASSLVDCHY